MADRYAVMGNPVAHSKSPAIHAMFAEQTGEDIGYERILVPVDDFEEAVERFRAEGGKGLNVTVPFKHQAWRLAERCSDRATRARAANTLTLGDGEIAADNTDGAGLVRDIGVNLGFSLHGAQILVLGAGGATRGIVPALLGQAPAQLVIANRTAAKARTLATEMSDLGPVSGVGLCELADSRYDAVINATSAGLGGELPPLPDELLRPDGLAYDLVYADAPTAFVRWGRDRGAAIAADGLGMLVEQAAESFYIWRGVRPTTADVIRALRRY